MNAKTETQTVEAPATVAKLTPAGMKFNPTRAKIEDKKVLLGRVWGKASGVKAVKAGNGDVHFALTGEFRGINADTGLRYASGVLYLPGGIHDMLQAAVDGGLDDNGKPIYREVQFGIDLSAVPAKNPIGYSYEAQSVIQAVEADPLAEMEAQMNEAKPLPAIEAQKK